MLRLQVTYLVFNRILYTSLEHDAWLCFSFVSFGLGAVLGRTDLSECRERVNFFEIHVRVPDFSCYSAPDFFLSTYCTRVRVNNCFFLSLVECCTIRYRNIFTS